RPEVGQQTRHAAARAMLLEVAPVNLTLAGIPVERRRFALRSAWAGLFVIAVRIFVQTSRLLLVVEAAHPAFEAVTLAEAHLAGDLRRPTKLWVAEDRVAFAAGEQGQPGTRRSRIGQLVDEPAVDQPAQLARLDLDREAVEVFEVQGIAGHRELFVPAD